MEIYYISKLTTTFAESFNLTKMLIWWLDFVKLDITDWHSYNGTQCKDYLLISHFCS